MFGKARYSSVFEANEALLYKRVLPHDIGVSAVSLSMRFLALIFTDLGYLRGKHSDPYRRHGFQFQRDSIGLETK